MSRDADVHPPLSRRRALQLFGGALAVAVSSRALRDATSGPTAAVEAEGGAAPVGDSRRGGADVGPRHYRGTATTTLDPDRLARGDERTSVRHGVAVTVTPPPEGDERSGPLDLTVEGTTEGAGAVPGRLVTADVTYDADGGRTVDRHWDIQAGEDGAFSGVLRDSDAAVNVLWSRRELIPGRPDTILLVSEAMSGGTALTGTVTADRIDIDVRGNTVNRFAADLLDGTRPFTTEIRATRVRDG